MMSGTVMLVGVLLINKSIMTDNITLKVRIWYLATIGKIKAWGSDQDQGYVTLLLVLPSTTISSKIDMMMYLVWH